MRTSLRTRLALGLAATSLLVWLGLAAWQYQQIKREVDRLFDAHIAEAASALHAIIRSEAQEHGGGKTADPMLDRFILAELEHHVQGPSYGRDHAYQITLGRSAQYFRSPHAPALRLADDGLSGFRSRRVADVDWRVFTIASNGEVGPLNVTVAEPLAAREPIVSALASRLGAALAGGLLLLWAIVSRVIAWGLRPLADIAGEVQQRAPNRLEPVALTGCPEEIAPLLGALNDLLARLDDALRGERQFTADAAHELRNPLAAIKTQAQVAERATDQRQRQQALAQVVAGVDRASHLVQQLLILARLDPDIADEGFVMIDLPELVGQCLREVAPNITERHISIVADIAPGCRVRGNAMALGIAVRNLLDNAARHGRDGGHVGIGAARHEDGGIELAIADDGPGIPPERREDVLRRFYRQPGAAPGGSGLGLAIVARIARLHRARLDLDSSPAGGLRVTLHFQPASVAS